MRKLLNFIYYRSFEASLGLHVKVKLQFVVYFFIEYEHVRTVYTSSVYANCEQKRAKHFPADGLSHGVC